MKNLGLGDLSVLAYGLNLAGYWPPCFNIHISNFWVKVRRSRISSIFLGYTGNILI